MNGNYSCFEFDKLIVNNYLLYECLWNMEKKFQNTFNWNRYNEPGNAFES